MIKITKEESILFDFLLKIAKENGSVIRVAGGWVRNLLIGAESYDIDVAVDNMSGLAFCKLCKQALGNNQNISVIEANPEQSKHLETAVMNIFGFDIDFCALRKETYADSRIPNIEPGTPEEDARRRDLTINAIFYNINTGAIEDFVGGVSDLELRIARTPIDAYQTFIDDPLRILRAIRFASTYGLKICDEIILAAKNKIVQNSFKTKISKERIFAELFGQQKPNGFKSGALGYDSWFCINTLKEMGFIDILFSPEGVELNPWDTEQNNPYHDLNILDHTIKAIDYFSHIDCKNYCESISKEETSIISLALMCHDLGKRDPGCIQVKDNGFYSYLGHDDRSVELTDIVLDQIGCYGHIKERVLRIVKHHMRYHALESNPTDKSLRRIIRDMQEDWKLLLIHSESDSYGKLSATGNEMHIRHMAFYERSINCLKNQNNSVKIQRPITGFDLINIGIQPGIKMGELFKILDEALLEDPCMTKETAINIVKTEHERM